MEGTKDSEMQIQMTAQQDPGYGYDQRDFPSQSDNSFGQGFFNQQARIAERSNSEYVYGYDQADDIPTIPTIVTQPNGPPVMRFVPEKPFDYSWLAIFACLCCCWPLGLCAIINAHESQTAYIEGDLKRAKEKSITSRNLIITSIVLGVIILTCSVITYTHRDQF